MPGPNSDQPVTLPAAEPATRFSNLLASKLDPEARKARANREGMEALLLALRQQEDTLRTAEAQKPSKRSTARNGLPPGNDWTYC